MSARTFKRDDRVYVTHPTPWSGRVGTVVRDEADSLGRVRVLLDGDDDGTGQNWVAIEAEYLIPSFDAEDVLCGCEEAPEEIAPPRRVKPLHTAIAIGAALVVGVASGAAIMGTPIIQAPHECTVALNTASKIFIVQTNLVSAVNARGDALDRETYAEHDGDVNQHLDELDELSPVYDTAEAECLGDR